MTALSTECEDDMNDMNDMNNTDAYEKAQKLVESFDDAQLQRTWDALRVYNPQSTANDIPMDDWAQMVYNEIGKRKSKKPLTTGVKEVS